MTSLVSKVRFLSKKRHTFAFIQRARPKFYKNFCRWIKFCKGILIFHSTVLRRNLFGFSPLHGDWISKSPCFASFKVLLKHHRFKKKYNWKFSSDCKNEGFDSFTCMGIAIATCTQPFLKTQTYVLCRALTQRKKKQNKRRKIFTREKG